MRGMIIDRGQIRATSSADERVTMSDHRRVDLKR